MKQKQMQKIATFTQVSPNSGGLVLRGVNPGFDTSVPTFEIVGAAGGNSVVFTLNSGNAALYEFIRVNVSDAQGNYGAGAYAGGAITVNTTTVSKASSSVYPNVTLEVVYKFKEGNTQGEAGRVFNYQVPIDAATLVAGFTIDTADRLNATDRGAYMVVAASYDGGTTTTTVDVTDALSLIGLDVEAFLDGVSIATGTIGADGSVTMTDVAVVAGGAHEVKVVVTTAGVSQNSFALASFTV